jgi:eukaryotic-like serine/threonine-protein kinase
MFAGLIRIAVARCGFSAQGERGVESAGFDAPPQSETRRTQHPQAMMTPERWHALSPLLDEALDREGDEREAWLQQLREDTPEDAAEIASLLASAEHDFLRSTGIQVTFAPIEPDVGQRLGAWTLTEPIGSGGMGTVWLAERNDGRFAGRAAVKLLHPSHGIGGTSARFRLEANALARLTHPNIARLFDAGVSDDGRAFLVLEYVDGVQFTEWCHTRATSLSARLSLCEPILSAVAHAHANGVVHRDIKPSNLMVTDDGVVKLLDFGIAAMGTHDDGFVSTAATAHAFTPRYAAPEQVTNQPLTAAVDVYALGVLIYELLANRHPTSSEHAEREEVLHGIVTTAPPRLPSSVPSEIDHVVRRALRKSPGDRYPTVTAFADDLARARRYEVTVAHPGSRAHRLRLFVRRNRTAVGVAAVIAASLVTTLAVTATQLRETRRQRDVAERAARRASVMSQVLAAGYDELSTPDSSIASVQTLSRIRDIVATTAKDDPALTGRLFLDLSEHLSKIGRQREADSLVAQSIVLGRQAGDVDLEATALCARASSSVGRATTPIKDLNRASRLLLALPDVAYRAHAACLGARGALQASTGALDSATASITRALALYEAAGDSSSSEYIALLSQLPEMYHFGGAPEEGAEVSRRLLRAYDATGRKFSMRAVSTLALLATYFISTGEYQVADSLVGETLDRLGGPANLARAPIDLLALMGDLASVYSDHRGTAVAWFTRALAAAEGVATPEYVSHLKALLAQAHIDAGEFNSARNMIESMRRAADRTPSPVVASRLAMVRAQLLGGEGRNADAARLMDSVMRAHGYPDALRIIDRKWHLARYSNALIRNKQYAAALEAERLYPASTNPEWMRSGEYAEVQMRIAHIAWGLGLRDSALSTVNRASPIQRRIYAPSSAQIREVDSLLARITRGDSVVYKKR